MIEYRKGNLLDVQVGIIVHGANAQGVMGSGVARAIRETYPECYGDYRTQFLNFGLTLGEIIWWGREQNMPSQPLNKCLFVANAITQEHFGTDQRHVNYVAIADTFKEVFRQAKATSLDVHFPKIGAGLGGGNWDIISEIIQDADPQNRVKKICWEL